MKRFHKAVEIFLTLSKYSMNYRLCWIPDIDHYACIEFEDEELSKLDPKKIIVLLSAPERFRPYAEDFKASIDTYIDKDGNKITTRGSVKIKQTPEEQENERKMTDQHRKQFFKNE